MAQHFSVIKLHFTSPLHLGTGKDNYDSSAAELQADSISAALAAVKVQTEGCSDVMGFLESFCISSAFPFNKENYFLPRPMGDLPISVIGDEDNFSRKALKKIQFIEKSIWEKIVSHQELIIDKDSIKHSFLVDKKNFVAPPYKKQVHQRVCVSRNATETPPFFFEWTFFDKDCGLYILTDACSEKLEELLKLFRILGEWGIGSDRNVGGGQFEVSSDSLSFSYPLSENDGILLLSPYLPNEDEHKIIDWKHSKFSLIERGGYMAGSVSNTLRHIWKRSVFMLNTGSVLTGINKPKGSVINLVPNDFSSPDMHPAYRSGRPFFLPFKLS